MKLPVLWLSLAFATSVECLALAPGQKLNWRVWLILPTAAILVGLVALWRGRAHLAWALVLLTWLSLGALAANLEQISVPTNSAARLIERGEFDTSEPLRWRGVLRDDPSELPWGRRYEIALEEVELAGRTVPVTGGLRANLFFPSHG
jgi:hypothetical protein